jgi:hypothetical protein
VRLEPFTGALGSPEHAEWMTLSLKLNRRAGAAFARRQTALGRPLSKRVWPDLRPPPGWYDNDETMIEG